MGDTYSWSYTSLYLSFQTIFFPKKQYAFENGCDVFIDVHFTSLLLFFVWHFCLTTFYFLFRRKIQRQWRFLKMKLQSWKRSNCVFFECVTFLFNIICPFAVFLMNIYVFQCYRRLSGKDLTGLGLRELQHLEQQLNEGLMSVKEKKVFLNIFYPFRPLLFCSSVSKAMFWSPLLR